MKYFDGMTMYRLLLYYLIALLGIAMFFGAIGMLPYSPYAIVVSAALGTGVCFSVNYVFAKLYNAPTNGESSLLTGLILALIITPTSSPKDALFIIAAASLAAASKYILAINNKHIFNPVAIAVVLTAFGPQESASWWIGSALLAPFVIVGGLLIVRKVRRSDTALTFIAIVIASTEFFAFLAHKDIAATFQATVAHSSLFFLAFVMLTEPWTSPTTRAKRYVFAAIVGILFAPALHVGSIYSTPESALVIGNLAAFIMTPIVKTKLHIGRRRFYGNNTEDIELIPDRTFTYRPGQYIEMTLPHSSADSRGLRRYFTLASSPTEPTLRLGVRYYTEGSSFKKALQAVSSAAFMSVGQLGGDFVLPKDRTQKLAFIAGGIGITPFRSMVKYLSDTGDARSVKLLYAERSLEDVVYKEIFEEARDKVGIDTTYVIATPIVECVSYLSGRIDEDRIVSEIPDYRERIFYVSGPQPMVRSVKRALIRMGVPRHHIKLDYFSGYA